MLPVTTSASSVTKMIKDRNWRTLEQRLLSLTRLFADDSSLFYSASSIQDIEGIINYDLRILGNWAAQWLIKFNPLKTVAEPFACRLQAAVGLE